MAGPTDEAIAAWLNAYGRAWEGRDPEAAAALFTEDGVYAWGPYEEPMRGRDAIRARWAEVTAAQSDVQFSSEVLGSIESGGVAHWACEFNVGEDLRIYLDGIFIVVLTEDGLCSDFREWWNERTSADET
ncbi:MAG TPA: nuclear transport factor 2 family protein [Thermoleophilaceae bacterium]